jgi:hypothetical protein
MKAPHISAHVFDFAEIFEGGGDAIFRAADALTNSAPTVLRALQPGSPTSQSLERLYEAAAAFQAAVSLGERAQPGESQ